MKKQLMSNMDEDEELKLALLLSIEESENVNL